MRKRLAGHLKQIKEFYSRRNIQILIGVSVIIFFTACYIILTLNKYWQFEYFTYDNAYFDLALWKLAHLQAPIVPHQWFGQINIFSDHFHPAILLFAALYLLTSRQEIILIGMSVVFGLSAYLAMLVSFKLIKSRLITYCLLIAYFLYLGNQFAFLAGFHEIFLFPFFFFLTLYFIFYNHWKLYWLGIALILLTKESMPFITIPLSFFIFFSVKGRRKEAIATAFISVTYYLIATRLIIPHFGLAYAYSEHANFPHSINEAIYALTRPAEKIETFIVSISTFGLLPLLNPFTLPLVAQDFVLRYVFNLSGNIQYSLNYHYGIGLSPILLFSSIWSVKMFQDLKIFRKYKLIFPVLAVFIVFISLYYTRLYIRKGPLLLVFNPAFYQTTRNNAFEWELIKYVPNSGTVMTMNQLGYIFSHQGSFLFPDISNIHKLPKYDPAFVVFDFRQGQNPNNYFPLDEGTAREFMKFLLGIGKYKIYFQKDTFYVLKKV